MKVGVQTQTFTIKNLSDQVDKKVGVLVSLYVNIP